MNKTYLIFLLVIGCAVARHLNSNHSDEDDGIDNSTCILTAFPPNPDSDCCGIDVSSTNNILGTPTLLNQYPWLALLEYTFSDDTVWTPCGGSLISGRYVLTAAHCVTEEFIEVSMLLSVVLGEYDRSHDGPDCVDGHCTDGEIRIDVEKVIRHAQYDSENVTNDIALLRLSTTAPYTSAIRPICLPTLDLNVNNSGNLFLYVTGWGAMGQYRALFGDLFSIRSDVKRHAAEPFVELSICLQKSWVNENNETIKPSSLQICAGGVKGEGSCRGDSGGPLMYENDGIFELSGVSSYGLINACGTNNTPSIYTNVYQYRKWIDEHITE